MNQADILGKALSRTYNCAHLVADEWERATGQDIRGVLTGFLTTPDQRRASSTLIHDLKRIPAPVSPCIVLLRRAKATPHVGIFIRGRVLHLTENGPIRQLLSIAAMGYHSVRFYAVR